MFCFCDFIIKYITIKHEKAGKHNFNKKKSGKCVFYKTKRSKQFAILIVNLCKNLAESLLTILKWEIVDSNKDVWQNIILPEFWNRNGISIKRKMKWWTSESNRADCGKLPKILISQMYDFDFTKVW